jgi:hypothetical protein
LIQFNLTNDLISFILAQAIVKVNIDSSQITEENDVELVCIVKGSDPEMSWYYKPETEDGEFICITMS